MERFLTTETLIIELLLIVSLVAIVVRRLRVPYTVALVVVGLLLTFQQPLEIDLTPELILALFVPPLIFEAAFHIEYRRLRENLVPILVLAVPGMLLSTFLVGYLVHAGVGIALPTALVFGALISATDPVAVIALFRSLGAPKRLTVVVEGESLFNDGTAIVVFNLMVAAALPGAVSAAHGASGGETFSVLAGIVDFLRVALGGLAVGLGAGWIVAQMIARIDDYLIEITLTTVLAFGAYLLAERLHVSGVLAVVAAGIVSGNMGPKGMSPTTRIVLFNFWEYLAFVANSLVFLLIGLDVNIPQIIGNLRPIGIAVLAVLASRALVIYTLTFLSNRGRQKVPISYQHVLFWGGLRGAISLALVLSLPAAFPDRELLRVLTFGVVLFTLLAQGTTMSTLLRWLGLVKREEWKIEYERRHGRLVAVRASRERLHELHREGMLSTTTWEALSTELDARLKGLLAAQQEILHQQPALQAEEQEDARLEGLRAQRAMLATLVSDGIISETVYEELVTEVDVEMDKEVEPHDAVAHPSSGGN